MPRVQVYLSDEMLAELRSQGFSPSKLLQDALEREVRQVQLAKSLDRYLKRLDHEFGPPTVAEKADAEAWAEQVADAPKPRARRRRTG
jgi:hypothetical protein